MNLIIFLITISIIVLVHEFGHFLLAKRTGIKVEEFCIGFGKKIFSFTRGGTTYGVCLLPLGGFVKMAGDEASDESARAAKPWEYRAKSVGARAQVVIAGPLFNYVFSFLLFTLIFIIGFPTYTPRVGKVLEGFPAQRAGILEKDVIIAVNGAAVSTWDDVLIKIREAHSEKITLALMRAGTAVTVDVSPQETVRKNIFGVRTKMLLIGVAPSQETILIKRNPLAALKEAASKVLILTKMTFQGLWYLVTGALPAKEAMMGPIGIYYLTKDVRQIGYIYFLQLLAVLNLSLAVFNVLPLPVLDGGHLLFFLIEKIRGKPVSARTQEHFTYAGIVLLVALAVFVSFLDLQRAQAFKKLFTLLRR